MAGGDREAGARDGGREGTDAGPAAEAGADPPHLPPFPLPPCPRARLVRHIP
jgi:hypothetical protein